MADIVNDRVNEAQAEMLKRAKKLEKLLATARGKKVSAGFLEGANLVKDMIETQTRMYDAVVFEAPKTALEQNRNLMLMTGNMNQSVKEGIKPVTDALDSMLAALEQMVPQR